MLSLVVVACLASGRCAAVFEFACLISVGCIQLYVYLIVTLVRFVFHCCVRLLRLCELSLIAKRAQVLFCLCFCQNDVVT